MDTFVLLELFFVASLNDDRSCLLNDLNHSDAPHLHEKFDLVDNTTKVKGDSNTSSKLLPKKK